MVTRKATLREVTLNALGDDLGHELLDRGAVHPIYGPDRKQPGYAGHDRPWLDHGVTGFVAAGFNAGVQSGLTVWDLDRRDIKFPVPPNVLTRRGSHVYTPFLGEKHLQAGVAGLDVLTNGNVVFWSDTGEKRVSTTSLASSQDLHDFWLEHAGRPIVLRGERMGTHTPVGGKRGTSTYASPRQSVSEYPRQVEARGYCLDRTSIETGAALRMAKAVEGTRNSVLYRQSLVLIQCGCELSILFNAARLTGLCDEEIASVMAGAIAAFDPVRMPSVLCQADAWREAVGPLVERQWHPMLDELVRRAVEQNTIAPMVNQSDFSVDVHQSTVSRRLFQFGQRGLIHKRPMGRRGLLLRSNCYRLCTRLTAQFKHQSCDCSRSEPSDRMLD